MLVHTLHINRDCCDNSKISLLLLLRRESPLERGARPTAQTEGCQVGGRFRRLPFSQGAWQPPCSVIARAVLCVRSSHSAPTAGIRCRMKLPRSSLDSHFFIKWRRESPLERGARLTAQAEGCQVGGRFRRLPSPRLPYFCILQRQPRVKLYDPRLSLEQATGVEPAKISLGS